MKTMKTLFLILTGVFFITGTVFSQTTIFEKTYSSESGKKINFSIVMGNITVQTWNKNEVKVTVKGDEKLKEMLNIEDGTSIGDINVKVKFQGEGYNDKIELSTDIFLPSSYNANVKTASGNLAVSDLNGNIDLKTAGGNIIINNTSGDLDVITAGGLILIENHSGDIDANTTGGKVNISSANGEIKVSTIGGNIDLVYSGVNEGIKLSTMGGNIDVKIPSDTKADLKLNTLGGIISVDFDVIDDKKNDNSLKGKINGGGEKINCNTMGGNIFIKK